MQLPSLLPAPAGSARCRRPPSGAIRWCAPSTASRPPSPAFFSSDREVRGDAVQLRRNLSLPMPKTRGMKRADRAAVTGVSEVGEPTVIEGQDAKEAEGLPEPDAELHRHASPVIG